jgi:hypothetical protein
LLAGLFFWSQRLVRGASLFTVGLILAVVLQNANTVSSMLSALQSNHRGGSQHTSPEQQQP